MNAISHVLAATDLSAPARHAAERAAMLAAESGDAGSAAATLLHVLPSGVLDELRAWLGRAEPAEALLQRAGRELRELADGLARRHGVAVDAQVASGPVVERIVQAADATGAGLVATGARGSGFLRGALLGSTAERLIHRTARPVLVVRHAPHGPYRRLLVPVDFSAWSDASLALARRVAPQAQLVLLHAFEVPFEGKLKFAGVDAATIRQYRRDAERRAVQQLHELAARHGLAARSWTPCVAEGDAGLRIVEHEQEQDADLVVVGKHGRNVVEELLLGSVTRRVLADAAGDVLVSTVPR